MVVLLKVIFRGGLENTDEMKSINNFKLKIIEKIAMNKNKESKEIIIFLRLKFHFLGSVVLL